MGSKNQVFLQCNHNIAMSTLTKYCWVLFSFLVILLLAFKAPAQIKHTNDASFRIYRDIDDYYYNMAYAKMHEKKYEEAFDAATVYKNMCGGCGLSHALLSIVLSQMGDKQKAAKQFELAKKACRNCAELYYEVAHYAAYKGDIKEAYAIMNSAFKKDSLIKANAGAYFFRGKLYNEFGDATAGHNDYLKAYAVDSSYKMALLYSLWFYAEKDSSFIDNTLTNFHFGDTAFHMYAANIYEQKACLYLAIGKYKEAATEAKTALYFIPPWWGLYYQRSFRGLFRQERRSY